MSSTVETADELRRFDVDVPDEELVGDASQGAQLALNALPQFKTHSDGLGIHLIHVRSRHEQALPLIITHGWPGSVIEMLEVVGPLTDPTAYGGPAEVLAAVFGGEFAQGLFKRVAVAIVPVGPAAWMLDHDADSQEKISHAFLDGRPTGGLTRDHIVDNLTLYWLTSTATSAARLYWENAQSMVAAIASGQKPPELSLPVAFTVFPDEIFQAPRGWAEKVYPNLVYVNEADKGGHFAAWEEPQLFSEEVRWPSGPCVSDRCPSPPAANPPYQLS